MHRLITELIRKNSYKPLKISEYMQLCLHHPTMGYYARNAKIGSTDGDFFTSPELNQCFGEMIAIWLCNTWNEYGIHKPLLIELGPGNGTLMYDMIKTINAIRKHNTDVLLHESSEMLKQVQKDRLFAIDDFNPKWISDVSTLIKECSKVDRPIFFIANEFFDTQPIRSFKKNKSAFKTSEELDEIVVGLNNENGQLTFGLCKCNPNEITLLTNLLGSVDDNQFEISFEAARYYEVICKMLKRHGGAALICDYGELKTPSDTLRAFHKGTQIHPLMNPGEADLTADVDFRLIRKIAQRENVNCSLLSSQCDFLTKMGIHSRIQSLLRSTDDQTLRADFIHSCKRLLSEMGHSFKMTKHRPSLLVNGSHGESSVRTQLLQMLKKDKCVNSLVFANLLQVDHQQIVGILKSLEFQGNEFISLSQNTSKKYMLTDEGQSILQNGSHEFRVWCAISENGLTKDKLFAQFDKAQIGFAKAMKNGWIQIDKSTNIITKKCSNVTDDVQCTCADIANSNNQSVQNKYSSKVLDDLKKRKLVVEITINDFDAQIGPDFTTDELNLETDLTIDMVTSGTWKHKQFKLYNFCAKGVEPTCGIIHPLSKVRSYFRQIFLEMGFEEMPTNRYVENSFWNFDALFQPQQHPARDIQDTFFLSEPSSSNDFPKDYMERVKKIHSVGDYGSTGYKYEWKIDEARKNILRTHTTAVSARMLYNLSQLNLDDFKPVKYFSIDKVFRNENTDATHLAEFHQVEGLIADYNLTLGDLIGILTRFYSRIGITNLKFKPAYNPYTEPSLEIFCYHEGLKKLIEVGNSGIFRPEMLRPMGFPPEIKVIAWGLSLERPAMILSGVSNIRDLIGHKMTKPQSTEFIKHYDAAEQLYAMNWSQRPDHKFRIGFCQCLDEARNQIEVIEFDSNGDSNVCCSINNGFPATKLMFIPDENLIFPDLFIATDNFLRIYKIENNSSIEIECKLKNMKEPKYSASLTSCDWNPIDKNLIATSSIDSTCTIWDIQFVAHDKESLDIAFSAKDRNLFMTCGADGTLRLFDLRHMHKSSVVYENPGKIALAHLDWNPHNSDYVATFPASSTDVYVVDVRMPAASVMRIPSGTISSISWSQNVADQLCTGDDAGNLLIWATDGDIAKDVKVPLMKYTASGSICQTKWSTINSEWIAITFKNCVEALKV
ncbi:hypothetical protein GJ496_005822 [Pomphorhynchus laevis]|nr:hypothetical protein GJ496_005822 [Pomphorhynchus laevis]